MTTTQKAKPEPALRTLDIRILDFILLVVGSLLIASVAWTANSIVELKSTVAVLNSSIVAAEKTRGELGVVIRDLNIRVMELQREINAIKIEVAKNERSRK